MGNLQDLSAPAFPHMQHLNYTQKVFESVYKLDGHSRITILGDEMDIDALLNEIQ